MKNVLILILLSFTLSSCTYKKELYSWNYKRIKEKIKFKINKKEKIYMNLSILKMKQILTILITILLFSSCGDAGTKTCIMKLQNSNNTVYSVDAFNYIVIEDSSIYHYIAESRYCGGDTYTRVKIK